MKRFLLSILCFVAVAMAGYAQIGITFDPEPGKCDKISEITVTLTEVAALTKDLTFTPAGGEAYVLNANNGKLDGVGTNYFNMTNTFTIKLGQEYTAPGEYKLYIPYEALVGKSSNCSAENTYTWTIAEGGGTTPVVEPIKFTSVTPNEGVVEKIENITVVTDTDITAAPTNWTFTDANGNVHQLNSVMVHPSMKNTLFIDFNPIVFTAAGTYTLNIPAGSLTGSDNKTNNEAKTYTWTIEASTPPAEKEYIVIDQDNDVSPSVGSIVTGSLSSIIIYTYNNNITDINEDLVRIEDANGTTYSFTTEHADYDVNGAYEVTFINLTTPITTIGACTLTMEEGAMVDGSNPNATNAKLVYSWTIAEAPKDYFEITSITPAQGNIDEIPTVIEVITNSTLIYEYDIEKMSLTDGTTNYPISEVELIETDPYVYVGAKLYLDNAITTPGTYTLTLEEGAIIGASFISTHSTNPLTTVEWTIEGGTTPEQPIQVRRIEPAVGTVTEIPGTISIYTDTDLNGADKDLMSLTDDKGASYEIYQANVNSSGEQGSNVFDLLNIKLTNGAITAPGTYTLNIQANSLDQIQGSKTNEELSFTWTIEESEPQGNYINVLRVDPEANTTVDEIPSQINIYTDTDIQTNPNGHSVSLIDDKGTSYPINYFGTYTSGAYGSSFYDYAYVTTGAILKPGTYTLTISAGSLIEWNNPSKTNEEWNFTWTVIERDANIVCERNYYLDINGYLYSEDNSWFAAHFTNIYTDDYTWVQGEVTDNGQVLFYLSQYNIPGDAATIAEEAPVYTHVSFYSMSPEVEATYENMDKNNAYDSVENIYYDGSTVPQPNGSVVAICQLGYDNVNYTRTYEWLQATEVPTALEAIAADAVDGYVVYDLNGYLVMHTRNAADIRNLEKGFYIINGKKVVLTR